MLVPQIVLAALCMLLGLAPHRFQLIHRALLTSPQGLGVMLAKAARPCRRPGSPAWRGRPAWRCCRRWSSPWSSARCSSWPWDLSRRAGRSGDRRAVALRLRGRDGSDALRRAQPVPEVVRYLPWVGRTPTASDGNGTRAPRRAAAAARRSATLAVRGVAMSAHACLKQITERFDAGHPADGRARGRPLVRSTWSRRRPGDLPVRLPRPGRPLRDQHRSGRPPVFGEVPGGPRFRLRQGRTSCAAS